MEGLWHFVLCSTSSSYTAVTATQQEGFGYGRLCMDSATGGDCPG